MFYGSVYASKYAAFVPVDERSNVLVSRKADSQSASSYHRDLPC